MEFDYFISNAVVTLCFCSTEAINAIIIYSQDAEELMKRKKVNRDVIFKYLASEGVVMLPNTEKHQLIRKTLEFWSSVEVSYTKYIFITRISINSLS